MFEEDYDENFLKNLHKFSIATYNCSSSFNDINPLLTRNIAYDMPKKVEPYIIVYKSKPIRGIVLELWGRNPEYNW